MNRFQSLLDDVQLSVLLDLSDTLKAAANENGTWIINGNKIAYRATNGELYDFDFDKEDDLSRAIVALFNHAHNIARNIRR